MALIVLSEPSGRPSIKAGGTGECEAVSGAALLINQPAFRLAAACLCHIATLLAHSAAPPNTSRDPPDLPAPSSAALAEVCFVYPLVAPLSPSPLNHSLSSSLPCHIVFLTPAKIITLPSSFIWQIFPNLMY